MPSSEKKKKGNDEISLETNNVTVNDIIQCVTSEYEMDDDDGNSDSDTPSKIPSKIFTSSKSSKFNPDLENISKSVCDLIKVIQSSKLPKRDMLPISKFLQDWAELYKIQAMQNQMLIEKSEILSSNNKSLQNAIQKLSQSPNTTYAQKAKNHHNQPTVNINTVATDNQPTCSPAVKRSFDHAQNFQSTNPKATDTAIWKTFNKSTKPNLNSSKAYVLESNESTGKSAKDLFDSLIDPNKLKLKIDKIVVGKQNRTVILTNDESQIVKIQKEIADKNITELTIRKPKEQHCRISINGVELKNRDDFKTLNTSIALTNEERNIAADDLKPLFAHKRKSGLYCVVFGTSAVLRKRLVSKKVFVGFSAHEFNDYINPLMCFRCNKYDHLSTQCQTKIEDIRCLKCGENGHETRYCKKEEVESTAFCASCYDHATRMKIEDQQTFVHWPGSRNCPKREILLKRALDKLTETTNAEQ